MNKEMEEGWIMRVSLELLPFADDDESDECSDEGLESSEATASFKSETMHRVFFFLVPFT